MCLSLVHCAAHSTHVLCEIRLHFHPNITYKLNCSFMCTPPRTVHICHREYDNIINSAIKDYKVIYFRRPRRQSQRIFCTVFYCFNFVYAQNTWRNVCHSCCIRVSCLSRLLFLIFERFLFEPNFNVTRDIPPSGERRVCDDKVYFAHTLRRHFCGTVRMLPCQFFSLFRTQINGVRQNERREESVPTLGGGQLFYTFSFASKCSTRWMCVCVRRFVGTPEKRSECKQRKIKGITNHLRMHFQLFRNPMNRFMQSVAFALSISFKRFLSLRIRIRIRIRCRNVTRSLVLHTLILWSNVNLLHSFLTVVACYCVEFRRTFFFVAFFVLIWEEIWQIP